MAGGTPNHPSHQTVLVLKPIGTWVFPLGNLHMGFMIIDINVYHPEPSGEKEKRIWYWSQICLSSWYPD